MTDFKITEKQIQEIFRQTNFQGGNHTCRDRIIKVLDQVVAAKDLPDKALRYRRPVILPSDESMDRQGVEIVP
jgi:hypothetical protein